MPNIVLKLKRNEAINVYTLIDFLGGDVAFKDQRTQLQAAIAKAWPEIQDAAAATEPNQVREVPYTSEQQRAMAEGLFAFCADPKTKGADYTAARAVGQICRLDGWLKAHIAAIPAQKFDGALDDEPDLLDSADPEPETAPAGTTVPFRPKDAPAAPSGPLSAAEDLAAADDARPGAQP